MDAPPVHESVESFVRVAAEFRELGLNVPSVFAVDKQRGFALLSDLGDRTYFDEIDHDNADGLYEDAFEALWQLQSRSRDRLERLAPYDAAKFGSEMDLFRQWFVPHRTSHRLSARDRIVIDDTFELLTNNALEQPRTWVHRDFHSRNLMITPTGSPGLLDFQDAVTGPITYDLVSLLRDCYIVWPTERVEGWLNGYFDRIRAEMPNLDLDPAQFVRWFDWMGVQRHIKVLGIFARLYYRDGKPTYLADLPVVHRYLCEVCSHYRALRPFADLLDSMEISWTP